MAKSILRVAAVCTAPLLWASNADAGTIRHDTADSAYLAIGNAAEYASVGQFYGDGFAASGTLIAANWVLTAGHVVDNTSNLDFIFGGTTFSATSWVAHERWNGDLGGGYDIGLVYFGDETVISDNWATRYTGSDEVGMMGTSVGFGTTGTGLTGSQSGTLDKRGGNNMIDAVLQTKGKDNRVLLSDFDMFGDPSLSSWGSSNPLDLEYLIAPGDSGGGLFVNDGGVDYLAGVHSFGWGILDGDPNSSYGDASGHTRVSSFNNWIDEILGISGGDGDKVKGGGNGGGGGGGNRGGGRPSMAATSIPEPSTLAIFGFALAGMGLARRRRKVA